MGDLSKRFYSIKNDREFRYLFRKGQSMGSYGFICYWLPNTRRRNRCGIATGKKIGGAVIRNRSRRVIREAFRLFDHELSDKTDKRYDFIFVARENTAGMKSTQILGTMRVKLMPLLLGNYKKNDRQKGGEFRDPHNTSTQKNK